MTAGIENDLAVENQKIKNDLDVLTKLTVDQYAEIKSLKEENERLKSYILDEDKHKINALKEIKGLAEDCKKYIQEKNEAVSQLSQAKERIKELETPNSWQVVDSDSSGECLDAEISYALDGVSEDKTAVIECWPFHHLPKKQVAAKFREDTCSWESIGEYDTLGQAQEALKDLGE